MPHTKQFDFLTVILVAAFLLGVFQRSARADFAGPLVQCSSVKPSLPAGDCGSDPLAHGEFRIGDDGEADVVITGAAANETYSVIFEAPTGFTYWVPLGAGSLTTDSEGNGSLRALPAFPVGKAGGGLVVLTRNSLDQYYSGSSIAPGGSGGGPDFEADLIQCKSVNIFTLNSTAGYMLDCAVSQDPLKTGSVVVDANSGDLTIKVQGALPNTDYMAGIIFNIAYERLLGTGLISTDSKGNAQETVKNAIAAGTNAAVTVELSRMGDQFVTGFKVVRAPLPPVQSSLVRCLNVNFGQALVGCGVDPLNYGSTMFAANVGNLTLSLSGARPNTAYEAFYRPLNTSGSADVDTKLVVTTDANGNVNSSLYPVCANGQRDGRRG